MTDLLLAVFAMALSYLIVSKMFGGENPESLVKKSIELEYDGAEYKAVMPDGSVIVDSTTAGAVDQIVLYLEKNKCSGQYSIYLVDKNGT